MKKNIINTKIFFCDHFSFDNHGKPTIFGIFKSIRTKDTPFKHLKFFFVAFIEYKTEEKRKLELELKISGPEGEELLEDLPDHEVFLFPDKDELIVRIELGNLEFNNLGDYTFELKTEGETVGKNTLTIKKVE